jgi:hypothetical protein
VVSGNFLISSESRLQEAAEMYAPAAPQKSMAPNSQAQDEFKKNGPESSGQLSTVPRPRRRRG